MISSECFVATLLGGPQEFWVHGSVTALFGVCYIDFNEVIIRTLQSGTSLCYAVLFMISASMSKLCCDSSALIRISTQTDIRTYIHY